MRDLILADRHHVRAVDQDVGRLHHRIAEKAERRQVAIGELFLLVLVRRHALEPAHRRDHAEQQRQLGVLDHARLDENRRARRVDADCEPVDEHLPARCPRSARASRSGSSARASRRRNTGTRTPPAAAASFSARHGSDRYASGRSGRMPDNTRSANIACRREAGAAQKPTQHLQQPEHQATISGGISRSRTLDVEQHAE